MSAGQPEWLRGREGAWQLVVLVQPGAARSEAIGVHDGRLKIRIQAPPVDGRANRALCEWIASRLALAPSRVRVVAGEGTRRKTVAIDGEPALARLIALAPRAGDGPPVG